MSKWHSYNSEINSNLENLYERKREAEKARFTEYRAAVKIQSWYKGNRWRQYLKFIHLNATIIQKFWRAYAGRSLYCQKLKLAVDAMCNKKYNDSAVRIQSRWRGYRMRKYEFDYYEYRKYLSRVEKANDNMLDFLAEYQKNKEKEDAFNVEVDKINKLKEWAEKNHHLLSTAVQPSIYNSPYRLQPDEKEKYLRHSQQAVAMKQVKQEKKKKSTGSKVDDDNDEIVATNYNYLYDPGYAIATKKSLTNAKLPPVPTVKAQGPFRSPQEVWNQRYRPLNSSLRVTTDFYSVEKARQAMKDEEWTKRLHDENFLPVINRPGPYQPLLITSSDYGAVPYGTVYFREEENIKKNKDEMFKTVVPPIQTFDKLNSQYVENYSV